jgi:hypothetical protein
MKQIRKNWLFVLVLILGAPISATASAKYTPYDLGPLPDGFEVRWPHRPRTEQVVEVASAAEFNAAANTPHTKVVVTADIPSTVGIGASDIDVRMADGVTVNGLSIGMDVHRIRVRGGRFGSGGINMAYPTKYYPSKVTDEAWQQTDVLFDAIDVNADAKHSAMQLRGVRVAVINSHLRGGEYAIWSDTSDPLVNSDVIIAGNQLESEGDQCTLRLVGVQNAVTVENRLEDMLLTGHKHVYRVHGESDQVFAARNMLVNGGTMMGTMPGDTVGEIWFEDNELHHTTEDLFHPDPHAVLMLHAHNNVAYSDTRTCFLCFTAPDGWDVADNELLSYEPAPSE